MKHLILVLAFFSLTICSSQTRNKNAEIEKTISKKIAYIKKEVVIRHYFDSQKSMTTFIGSKLTDKHKIDIQTKTIALVKLQS